MSLQAFRASLLWFPDGRSHHVQFESDGMLVTERQADGVARVKAIGPHALLQAQYPQVPCTDWRGRWIAPGFVDLHIHYAQTDVIASPADGLLPWLHNYTFPQETRFADPAHAHEVAHFFFDELTRHGVTTALTFATAHTASVDAFFQEAQQRHMRMLGGRVLQDRHSPDGLRDSSAQQSLLETESLINRWHGVDRLGYAITPRFAPTSSEAQLRGAGELASQHPSVWVQTHVAENADEIQWVAELFPMSRSYLGVYEDMGLLRERSVYAHCLHLDADDRDLMAERGAAAAVCPTSNLFLDSGFFDFEQAQSHRVLHGLASDVGGGTSFSPFHTMHAAYTVGRQSAGKPGHSLSAEHLWWLHTAGAAQALGLHGVVGNLAPGCEADFVVLNPQATPLLARRTAAADSLEEQLFAMIVLGDDRLVEHVVVNGQTAHSVKPL
ncbi:MAG: Guanine deaminase [Pseudomonadota bacterium]